jgi:hypothetical protein
MVTSREFAQQARRDRECQNKRAAAQPFNRELAQRARRNQELLFTQQPTNAHLAQPARRNSEHVPIARQPLLPQLTATVSFRHRLNRCDVPCRFCGAEHWIEEKVQGSTKSSPKFSTCCEGGTVMMDKFDDPPQPLYSLLMDLNPCMFPCHIFADDERLYISGKIFEIITMPSRSVPSVSKEISLFMALEAYIPFVSRVSFVISSDPFFRAQGHSLHFHRSISTILTQFNRRNSGCLIITIYLT